MRNILIAFLFTFISVCDCYAGYSRIVSLSPAVTSCLYDLKSEDKLIAVTLYCKAEGKEIVGTLLEPNLEKIISMNPDLVLAEAESTSRLMVDKLKALGLNVVVIEPANSFAKICDNFTLIGNLSGKPKEAEEIILAIKNRISLIGLKIKGLPEKTIFWQLGIRPLVTVNDETYVSDLIRFAGGTNIFSDAAIVYPPVGYEEVVKRDPDVIVITGMGEAMQEELARWRAFKGMKAAQNGSVFILDPYIVCQPTPSKFLKGLQELVKLIHPEAFK